VCGVWLPRQQSHCGRKPGHAPPHESAASLERRRIRRQRRVRDDNPLAVQRWRRKHRLAQYGLTEEAFARLLEAQANRCAMCGEPFQDGQSICIDHDHACCEAEKRSCGRCVRGLLCLSCNTALGIIERKAELARAYLDRYQDPRRPESAEALTL